MFYFFFINFIFFCLSTQEVICKRSKVTETKVVATQLIRHNNHKQPQRTLSPQPLPNKTIGLFTEQNKKLDRLTWGNWGSRPWEYAWVSEIVSVAGKKVIDLGCGLPSQYNWYQYVANKLNPAFYAGIDFDGRIKKELVRGKNFEIRHMNMAKLEYPSEEFDIAFCISTFEHLPYDVFMEAIKEAHRVLKKDGLLVITLDEQWDKNLPITSGTCWNDLEQSLQKQGLLTRAYSSFGLPRFLELIQNYFTPTKEVVIDSEHATIYAKGSATILYKKINRDPQILHSPEIYNSCVSYAVLKKCSKN